MFFLYFALKDYGIAPNLGGYFAPAIFVSFIILLPHSILKSYSNFKFRTIDLVFLITIFTLGFTLVFISAPLGSSEIVQGYFYVFVTWITLYCFSVTIAEDRIVGIVSIWSLVLVHMIVIFFSRNDFAFSLGAKQQIDIYSTDPTYQFFAVFFLIGLMPVVINCTSRVVDAAIIIGRPALILIGSRTDFIVLAVTFFLYRILGGISWRSLFTIIAGAGVLLLSIIYVSSSKINRLAIFLDVGGGENQSIRYWTNLHAWEVISRNFIFGDAGNYPSGLYAHSILSVWVDFGIFGFILYTSCLIYFLLVAYRNRRYSTKNGVKVGAFAFAFLVSILATLASTKSADYYLLPVSLGLVSWVQKNSKKEIREVFTR